MRRIGIVICSLLQFYLTLGTSYKLKFSPRNTNKTVLDPCTVNGTQSPVCQNNGTCTANGTRITCDCGDGYYFGDRCEQKNPCVFENNCQNEGICSRLTDDLHACYCLEGTHGLTCQYVDACSSNPCKAGSCETLLNEYKCHCFEGFRGSQCEERNPCILDNKCQNSGQCVRISDFEAKCDCLPEFTGEYCEYSNACYFKSPCKHAGICRNDRDGFICDCAPGYFGSRCQDHNPCILQNIQCLNGGKCERLNNRVGKCICTEQYIGEKCTVKRPCAVNSCRNQGSCKVSGDGYGSICLCPYGFSGDVCQTRDPCKIDGIACHNGGSCTRISNLRAKCTCPAPYYGATCELRDYCSYGTCKHGGTCLSLQEQRDFKCLCLKGYAGKSCEFKNFCATIFAGKCLHNSTCIDQQDEVTIKCYCPKGYMGTYCEHRNPCELDGIGCIHGSCERLRDDLAHCVCDTHYHGNKCEFSKACLSSPCENNGKCVSIGNVYRCTCPVGFRGEKCELKCPECLKQYERHYGRAVLAKKPSGRKTSALALHEKEDFCETKFRNSCKNGGHCVNGTRHSFQCICTPVWSGSDCSVEDYTCTTLKCVHGSKTSSADGSACFCSCTKPFAGTLCTEKDPCEGNNQCGPNGVCLPRNSGTYVCNCKPGFSGPFCSVRDPCQLEGGRICENGGSCVRIRDFKYTCKCRAPFSPPDCKEENWCTIPEGKCIDNPKPQRCFPCRSNQNCTKLDRSSYTCTSVYPKVLVPDQSIIRRKSRVRISNFYRENPGQLYETNLSTLRG